MTRRILALITLAFLAVSTANAARQWQMYGAHMDTDKETGEAILTGNARVETDDALLLADQIRYNPKTQIANARGRVTLTQGARRIVADEVIYNVKEKTFSVRSMRLGEYPFYVSGDEVSGNDKEMTIRNAILSYMEPAPFSPTLSADTLVYTPNDRILATDARLGLARGPRIPMTTFSQDVQDPLISYMNARVGQRSSLGFFADVGLHLPVYPGVRAGGDVAYFTSRGVLFGPSGTYNVTNNGVQDSGSFSSGYIHDTGDRLNDILNRPIHADRSFVSWSHRRADASEHTTVVTEFNYWSDSSILRDFRPGQFFPVQQPDNFIEASSASANTVVSLFVRAQPNTYYRVQQRLPELHVDLLPSPLDYGLYHRLNASAAALRERQFSVVDDIYSTSSTLTSNRLDAFYSLTRPVVPREWLTFTPVAGGRITHYAKATGGRDHYTRALGELGFDASLRASGVYDYKNERWGIDGIRHLVTPKVSYRYIPSADKGRAYIPQIDDLVFDTALQPLELGDRRNIDDLHATNTLRLGLDNTFQTRDKTYGSRDLLSVNIAGDLRFHREPGEKDLSEIHTGISFMPARWMQLDVYNSFSPQDAEARELNTRLSLHDGDVWSLSFANHFLQDQIEEYISEARYRFNEAYQVVGRLHWDARNDRFIERSLTLVHNVQNLWTIEYGVSYYQGRKRESSVGYSVSVRLKGL